MKISDNDQHVWIDMYASGLPLRLIGEWFGVSHVLVAVRLDEWGVKRRNGDPRARCNKQLIGKRFGKLLVLDELSPRSYPARWIVHCDCGNIKFYDYNRIMKNRSCSCGKRGRRRKDPQ